MSAEFIVKKGTLPLIVSTLSDENGVYDGTGTTLYFVYRNTQSSVPVRRAASWGVAVDGEARYQWVAGDDVACLPGVYEYEWDVEIPAGGKATFPNGGPGIFVVADEVG